MRLTPAQFLVYDGVLRFSEDGVEYEVAAGEYFIQRKGTMQRGDVPSDAPKYLYIHFLADWTENGSGLPRQGNFDIAALWPLMERIDRELPEKTMWIYTGYDFEGDLLAGKLGDWSVTERILQLADVIVDGEFVDELKSPDLRFKGSSNQRIIDVQASLAKDEIVLWRDEFTTEKDG